MPDFGEDFYRCPKCGGGYFIEVEELVLRKDHLSVTSVPDYSVLPAVPYRKKIKYICANKECGAELVRGEQEDVK
jgi:hypothetical protein